jgi:hypothetical protein
MDLDEDEDPKEPEALADEDEDDGDHGDISDLDSNHDEYASSCAQATRVSFVLIFCMVGLSGMYS